MALLFCAIFTCCSPQKGYVGVELPETELSKVVFVEIPKVYTSNLVVDDYKVGDTFGGVLVKHGNHIFSYMTRYDEGGCDGKQRDTRYNYDGPTCIRRMRACRGTFQSEKGQEYKVAVSFDGAIVTRQNDSRRVGSATCERSRDKALY